MTPYYLYEIIDKRDGSTVYIGQTKNPKTRWKGHRVVSVSNRARRSWLHKHMRKHGVEHFEMRFFKKTFTREEIDEAERLYIEAHKELGFELRNISEGGGRGDVEAANRAGIAALASIKTKDPSRWAEIQEARAKGFASVTPEDRKRFLVSARSKQTKETKSAHAKQMNAMRTPEERARIGALVAESNRRRSNADYRALGFKTKTDATNFYSRRRAAQLRNALGDLKARAAALQGMNDNAALQQKAA